MTSYSYSYDLNKEEWALAKKLVKEIDDKAREDNQLYEKNITLHELVKAVNSSSSFTLYSVAETHFTSALFQHIELSPNIRERKVAFNIIYKSTQGMTQVSGNNFT